MNNTLTITLSVLLILSVAALGAYSGYSDNAQNVENKQTELVIKGLANGAISIGMSAEQIEKAIK